jgi:drug/metabolite transporter (DMT)-like permease
MRPSMWAGIALIIAGAALFFRGGFTKKEEVLDIGPLEVSTSERQEVPPWISGLVVVAGVLLVATGSRSRSST